MKIRKLEGELLIALLLLILISVFFSVNAAASPDKYKVHHDHHPVTNGIDGKDGTNGIDGLNADTTSINNTLSANSTAINNNYDALAYKSNLMTQGVAIAGAMSQIPALSHVGGKHGHTGISIAGATYSGNNALAVGIQHQVENMSFIGSVGASGGEVITGAGATWSW